MINISEYLAKVSPYLALHYSLHKSCLLGKVPYRTVKDYYDKDEKVRKKIERLGAMVQAKARRNIVDMIQGGDVVMSQWWLERIEKETFSTRTENKQDISLNDEVRKFFQVRIAQIKKSNEDKSK